MPIRDIYVEVIERAERSDPEEDNIIAEFCDARDISHEESMQMFMHHARVSMDVCVEQGGVTVMDFTQAVAMGFQVGFELAAEKYIQDPRTL